MGLTYEFLDHTADTIILAKGENLAEAFEQAALGFYDVITDPNTIEGKNTKEITIKSEDIEALLFDWIDQLIFYFDTENFISNNIQITSLAKIDNSFILEATLVGEQFEINKHPQETEVKAMTYSFMKIGDDFVEFTLDL
ncbi:MAG: archease [Asgard group archaeon]|nr:archease [Asgard group archaeon]